MKLKFIKERLGLELIQNAEFKMDGDVEVWYEKKRPDGTIDEYPATDDEIQMWFLIMELAGIDYYKEV
jgi:hypothetical protein